MKLSNDQIASALTGAARIIFSEDGVMTLRFTKEQEDFYKLRDINSYNKSFASAGVKLCFTTDSETMHLGIKAGVGSSRRFFAFDVYSDGAYVGSLDNYSHAPVPDDYIPMDAALGHHEKSFELPKGEKTVTVYFPWSASTTVCELSLSDGASFTPVKRSKKLLVYGDSITHGYDALHPYNRYPSRISDALDADEYNKAIGGEVFAEGLSALADEISPDYITVAYGTNDWGIYKKDDYLRHCRGFIENLSKNYPEAKIFVITPIWRKDLDELRSAGRFYDLHGYIEACAEGLANVTVISGFDFVQKDASMFSDKRLHPNDKGFEQYYHGLLKELKKYI